MGNIFKTLILALAIFFIACGNNNSEKGQSTDKSKGKKVVFVEPAKKDMPKSYIEYVGTLEAYQKIDVSTEVGGRIERLFFEKGDRTEKGQVLAHIGTSTYYLYLKQAEALLSGARSNLEKIERGSRPEEIKIEEALLMEAKSQLEDAERDFHRISSLYKTGAVSKKEYDDAKKMLDLARARVKAQSERLELVRKGPREEDIKSARARLKQAQAEYEIARDRYNKSIIRAPIDGVVAFRELDEGEIVPSGTVITRIIDSSRMKIRIACAEKDIPSIKVGNRYVFTVDAIPGREFISRVKFVSPSADPVTRSFPVELIVDNPDPSMADGMSCRVRINISQLSERVRIPSSLLKEKDGKWGVFIVSNGKARFKEVKIGSFEGDRVEIISGLKEGELLIINPSRIRDGDDVETKQIIKK